MDIFVIVYLDNILIFSRDEKQHTEHVRAVLESLLSAELYVKPEKCSFDVIEVEFLGHVLTIIGVALQPEKVSAVLNWPEPTCIADIQEFLGFIGYCRRFIAYYFKITLPLTTLLKGGNLSSRERHKQHEGFFTDEA